MGSKYREQGQLSRVVQICKNISAVFYKSHNEENQGDNGCHSGVKADDNHQADNNRHRRVLTVEQVSVIIKEAGLDWETMNLSEWDRMIKAMVPFNPWQRAFYFNDLHLTGTHLFRVLVNVLFDRFVLRSMGVNDEATVNEFVRRVHFSNGAQGFVDYIGNDILDLDGKEYLRAITAFMTTAEVMKAQGLFSSQFDLDLLEDRFQARIRDLWTMSQDRVKPDCFVAAAAVFSRIYKANDQLIHLKMCKVRQDHGYQGQILRILLLFL